MTHQTYSHNAAAGLITLLLLIGSPGTGRSEQLAQGQILTQLCTQRDEVTQADKNRALAAIAAAVAESDGDPDLLVQKLTALGKATQPSVTRADLDGDGEPDTLISFGWCAIPVMLVRSAAPRQVIMLPGPDHLLNWHGSVGARIARVADINADGKPELVVEFRAAGGSADLKWLSIYQWQSGRVKTLFADQLSDWVGENHWSIGPGTVTVQCHPFGPYEFKLMEHRQQTEQYGWDPTTRRYKLLSRANAPVPSRHLQVTEAEQLFQQGRYDEAAAAFRQVPRIPVLNERRDVPDWTTYSQFRLGQIHALRGNRAAAIQALGDATATDQQPLAHMAHIFTRYYRERDVAEAFYQVWRWIRLEAYDPTDPGRLSALWPWVLEPHTLGARRAILDAYRQVGRQPPDDLPADRSHWESSCLDIRF